MFGLWFAGFLGILAYRLFDAGFNARKYFYRYPNARDCDWDGELVFFYIAISILVSLTWLVTLPGIIIFKIGKRFNKDA